MCIAAGVVRFIKLITNDLVYFAFFQMCKDKGVGSTQKTKRAEVPNIPRIE